MKKQSIGTKVGLTLGAMVLLGTMVPTQGAISSVGISQVEAASVKYKTTYKTTANLNLRSGASTKHKVLVTIPKGKAVSYVSKSGSWTKVKYGSKTGFVSTKYLKSTKVAVKPKAKPKPKPVAKPAKKPVPKATATKTTYTTTAGLNLRSGASTKHKVLLTIPKGKAVTYVSKSGSWSKVKYGSKTGFVSTKYLKVKKVAVKPVAKPTPKPAKKPVKKPVAKPTATKTTYTTTAGLNLRSGASTKHKVLLTIPKGKAVTYVSKSGSWSKVKYGSKTGFVSTKYLKVKKVAVKPVVKPTQKPAKKPVVKPTPKPTPVAPNDKFLSLKNANNILSGAVSTNDKNEKLFIKAGNGNYHASLLPQMGTPAYNIAFVYLDSKKAISMKVNTKTYRDNAYHRVEADKAILVATQAFFGANKKGSQEMHTFIKSNLNSKTSFQKKMKFGGNQATVTVSEWDVDIQFAY